MRILRCRNWRLVVFRLQDKQVPLSSLLPRRSNIMSCRYVLAEKREPRHSNEQRGSIHSSNPQADPASDADYQSVPRRYLTRLNFLVCTPPAVLRRQR